LARLGSGARRFFASPDVSLTRRNGRLRTAIASGSGWLVRPRDVSLEDRVYVLFEPDRPSPVLEDGDLHDATGSVPLPMTATGWYLRLDRHGPGEKVIGPTVTFDQRLRFQTYQPLEANADAPCGPPRDVRRLYTRDLRTALPASSVADRASDDAIELAGNGLPVALRFAFPAPWDSPCDACKPRPFATAGATIIDSGFAGDPVRTSWRRLPPPPASP